MHGINQVYPVFRSVYSQIKQPSVKRLLEQRIYFSVMKQLDGPKTTGCWVMDKFVVGALGEAVTKARRVYYKSVLIAATRGFFSDRANKDILDAAKDLQDSEEKYVRAEGDFEAVWWGK